MLVNCPRRTSNCPLQPPHYLHHQERLMRIFFFAPAEASRRDSACLLVCFCLHGDTCLGCVESSVCSVVIPCVFHVCTEIMQS